MTWPFKQIQGSAKDQIGLRGYSYIQKQTGIGHAMTFFHSLMARSELANTACEQCSDAIAKRP
jgi:hypothetical protein